MPNRTRPELSPWTVVLRTLLAMTAVTAAALATESRSTPVRVVGWTALLVAAALVAVELSRWISTPPPLVLTKADRDAWRQAWIASLADWPPPSTEPVCFSVWNAPREWRRVVSITCPWPPPAQWQVNLMARVG